MLIIKSSECEKMVLGSYFYMAYIISSYEFSAIMTLFFYSYNYLTSVMFAIYFYMISKERSSCAPEASEFILIFTQEVYL